jgi:hypothetical protein
MDCYSDGVGLKLQLSDAVGLVVNFLIIGEVLCGLLIWCVSWVPAMVEVPTPAETRKFWGLSSLLSTSSDRLMQMILWGLGGHRLCCVCDLFYWKRTHQRVLNYCKWNRCEEFSIPHFLTIQHWCTVDCKEGPEPTLNHKFFKETLWPLGWFSYNYHTIWQHDRNATLLGVFPLSNLNLHIIITLHNGGISNFQRDPVCDNALQDV